MAADRTAERDLIIGVAPFGPPSARLAVAVARAGGLGALDLGHDRETALTALEQVCRWWNGPFAVRIPAGCPVRPEELPEQAATMLVDAPALAAAQPYMPGRRLLVEVVDAAEARAAVRMGADGLVARGCEAGGRVGELTTFVLLQRLLGDPESARPVWAAGGIGPHTAAAAVAGGAAGVVLDGQLALVREMDLPREVAAAIAAMDGTETRVVAGHRVHARSGPPSPDTDDPARMHARLGGGDLRGRLLPIGQEGAFAGPLADRHKTAGGVVQAVREQITAHLAAAVRVEPLASRDGAHPVLQAPMAWISDGAEFAAAVAQEGGVPFLEPASMSGDEVRRLLADTAERLAGRPWGVGLSGSAPGHVRAGQLAAVRDARPPYALIADGDPARAARLEEAGIAAYLHVSSPGSLERLLAEGARRFVFEGMEGGGHVGPLAAFPLWETQVERLLAFADEHPGAAGDLCVAFAGGVHDERSAAMIAALAAPLAERGADVRVLMGTAYLFTREAVAAGAIVPGFQRTALECDRTVLLETSPGHAVRCAATPYAAAFEQARLDLTAAGMSPEDVWARLERLNLGRLRLAGRGLRRRDGELVEAGEEEQRREGLYMIGQAAVLRSQVTTVAALHEQVSDGATRLVAERARALGLDAGPAPAEPLDIAIVGIDCVLPGARDAHEYWTGVITGSDAITEIPAGRWDPEVCWDPESRGGDRTPSRWGGFLPDVPLDAAGHGVPPASLGGVEPVQLLALEVAARALADAGYADRPFDRSRTAVIFGAGADLAAAYGARALLPQHYGRIPDGLDERLPRLTEDSLPGVLPGMIAARVAGRLGLGGAAYTVDAAGAASLAALGAACRELTAGTADMVLCGGADLHNGIADYLLYASAGALSPTGRCAPFDASADGTVLGEGVACVVLKRLADAERDGDRIYAVVKSVGACATGRRPALDRAYRAAGVDPARVGLVEAHGTGVPDDDRAELAALTETFAGAEPGQVVLGSVKSRIGHTRCAAGLAGLIKAVCALHTGVLPGSGDLREPIPDWDPRTSPFSFGGRTARPWAAAPADRYAGVGASGFGGAHFHTVLAGYDGAPEPVSGVAAWPAELFLVRGADRDAARAELDRLDALLAAHGPAVRLRDLARTVAERTGDPVQVALVATGPRDLADKIGHARRFESAPGVFPAAGTGRGQVAFLFPGQGGRRPGMLADLFVAFPRLQRLLRRGDRRYAEAMYPPASFTDEDRERRRAALTDTRIAQPALGIAGIAAYRLLTELGVRPDMAAGHGYGELVALCAAGVYGERDMLELSAARAEAILRSVRDAGAGDPGAMAAVAGTPEEVAAALGEVPGVVVAGHDAPRQVVIAGPTPAVREAVRTLAARGLAAEPIPAACAFHSPLAAGAVMSLSVELAGRALCSPAFPVWSNATAAPYDSDPDRLAAALAEQAAAPVRFVEQVEAMYAAGARVFVETGPGRALTRLVGRILGDRPHTAVAFDRSADPAVRGGGMPGLHGLLLALAELAAAGVEVDALPLFTGRDAVALSPDRPPARPGWIVNGHLVRTVDGDRPPGGPRPVERVAPPSPPAPAGSPDRDAAVLEFLRATRETLAAQREVILGYLNGRVPDPRRDPTPVTAPDVPQPRQEPEPDRSETRAAAETAVPAARTGPGLRAEVLAVISARTGYPEEMLGPGLDLEADLAIDSVQRTEIIGYLADRMGLTRPGGGVDGPVAERLARIRTIDEMVTWLDGHLGDRPGTQPDTRSATQPDMRPDARPGTRPDARPGARLDARPDAQPDARPDTQPDMRPGTRPDARPDVRSDIQLDAGPEAQLDMRPDARPDARPGTRSDARPDTRAEARSDVPVPRAVPPVRHVVRTAEPPPAAGDPAALAGLRCVIVNDGRGIAPELAALLDRHGAHARIVSDTDGRADAVIHLAALRPGCPPSLPGAYTGIRDTLLAGTGRLLLATGAGGTFGHRLDGGSDPVTGAGLPGLARTLALEFPDVPVRAVDLHPDDDPRALAARLLAELTDGAGPVVVGYDGDVRRTLELVPRELAADDPLPLDGDSVVLLTGGARGITARVASALATATGCHLELVGRTPVPRGPEDPATAAAADETALRHLLAGDDDRGPARTETAVRRILAARELRATFAELDGVAASVRYHRVDVADPQAVRTTVQDVYARHGRLDGVIHGAGIAEDALVVDKDPASFARVWNAKAGGARALADAVRPDIGFFVVLGDAAGLLGGRGRAGHAAAADACGTLARLWRRRMHGRVLVADWGPWAAGEPDREDTGHDMPPLAPDAAVAALLREIASGTEPQVVLTGGAL
ncbi:type I polyketide synthase [Thermomonospora amylolytica]|uniref:type I polyketide synthase n=1 Tax=Thermomonospora amylolytica TaxID=1411117 RepID=UPI0018E4E028|nr:type I polyketide synthase [Thermomonospora amylolytica]